MPMPPVNSDSHSMRALQLPAGLNVAPIVRDSLDDALLAATRLPAPAGQLLTSLARASFDDAFVAVLASATAMLLLAALAVRLWSGSGRGEHSGR